MRPLAHLRVGIQHVCNILNGHVAGHILGSDLQGGQQLVRRHLAQRSIGIQDHGKARRAHPARHLLSTRIQLHQQRIPRMFSDRRVRAENEGHAPSIHLWRQHLRSPGKGCEQGVSQVLHLAQLPDSGVGAQDLRTVALGEVLLALHRVHHLFLQVHPEKRIGIEDAGDIETAHARALLLGLQQETRQQSLVRHPHKPQAAEGAVGVDHRRDVVGVELGGDLLCALVEDVQGVHVWPRFQHSECIQAIRYGDWAHFGRHNRHTGA
mmetsp:Transcript_9184/g.23579  ORF Transcript_9184/g.23579 Transcript_9184/m.23579 type:complete len:265 (-) Transcript_9184:483-1277(-)